MPPTLLSDLPFPSRAPTSRIPQSWSKRMKPQVTGTGDGADQALRPRRVTSITGHAQYPPEINPRYGRSGLGIREMKPCGYGQVHAIARPPP